MRRDITPYRPRHFRFDAHWVHYNTIFKPYLITQTSDDTISGRMLSQAKAYIDQELLEILENEDAGHNLGYVILHAGEMGNWLLIHWWAHHDIAMRMLAVADNETQTFRSQDHKHFHACVWEHVVIDHERDAWVSHMMKDDSNVSAYLNDTLPDGHY